MTPSPRRAIRSERKERKFERYGKLVLFFTNVGNVYDKWQKVWFYEAKTPSVAGRYGNAWNRNEGLPV